MRINYQIVDNRKRPGGRPVGFVQKWPEPPAYPEQNDCVNALFKAESGIAIMPTGVGKSRIIKDSIQVGQRRSIVVTPSTILKEQTAEYLSDCFGSDRVSLFSPRGKDKDVLVINYHAFKSQDPRRFKDYDAVYFDEWQHAQNESIRESVKDHLTMFHKYALTATNYTNEKDAAILLECVLSNTVYQMSIPYAISKRYIKPVQAIFIEFDNAGISEFKAEKKKDANKAYQENERRFITQNSYRNEIFMMIADHMKRQNIPTLTLVRKIEHGKTLARGGTFLEGKSAKTNMQKIHAFNNREIDHITGTTVIGEGVNTKACGAILNAGAGKSKPEQMQRIGRACRLDPLLQIGFYFDAIDNGCKSLKAQSKTRIKNYETEYGMKAKILKADTIQNALNP